VVDVFVRDENRISAVEGAWLASDARIDHEYASIALESNAGWL
jgi:hypothetical protein